MAARRLRCLTLTALIALACAAARLPTEVARSACALARNDCSRKGRRPLRAGGQLLPLSFDVNFDARGRRPRPHRADGPSAVQAAVEALFEAAMVNASVELRPHMSTVLEYSQRSRSVLQLGMDSRDVSAWIAILMGGLQRKGQLYQMHQLPATLKSFQTQHSKELQELGINIVDGRGSLASELLFFTSTRDLNWHHLAAQGAAARVMLLHGMHHLWEQLEDWLKLHSAWQLTESSSLGAGFAVLSRRRDGFDGDGAQSTKSSNCSWSLWAQIMRKATTLLEVRHDYPSMLGSTWQVKMDMVKSFQRNLVAIKSKCPEAEVVLQILEELFESDNPEDLQGLLEATFGHKTSEKSRFPALKSDLKVLKDVEIEHPESALLLLYRGQLSHEVQEQVLERAIAKWPHRSEFWYLLAEDLIEQNPDKTDNKRALHAIRRSFSLSHFDRALVHRLLPCLEKLHRANEAALLWKAVAGSGGSARLWDDPRRTALAAISIPQVAGQMSSSGSAYPNEEFLEAHPEFKFARDYMERFVDELLNEQLNIIRSYSATDVNGYCKDNGWCEYVFLLFEYCHFLAECSKVPQTCRAARLMEEQGLRILRASLSLAGSPEVDESHEGRRKLYIQPHASPEIGRMRLSCTLLVSPESFSTLRIENEKPRTYRQGGCFWFDESMTHEMDFQASGPETLRATLYLDALHPGYYQQRELHYWPPANTLPWWQRLLEKMGQPSHTRWMDSRNEAPRRYWASPLKSTPWVSFATESLHVDADICLRGDLGLLFHQNAFWSDQLDRSRPLVMLQLFQRMRALERMGQTSEDLMQIFHRTKAFSQLDLDQLTQETWWCLAAGCAECQALELFGLCYEDLDSRVLFSLFHNFAQTVHIPIHFIKQWFEMLGFTFPPPAGYHLTKTEINRRMAEKGEEIHVFFDHVQSR